MMWWNGAAGWAGLLLLSVGMVAFWLLVIMAITALLPGSGTTGTIAAAGDRNVLRDLDERLGCGELDVQDYRAARKLLCGDESIAGPAQFP